MKSVIVEDHRPTGGRLLENPEFLRFAAHWGFRIRACRPYRAKTKGKVERPVGYLRGNFLYGRTFLGDADLADQCARWLTRANQRVHSTTRVVPLSRLAEEQAAFFPLAARPYRSLVLTLPPPQPKPPRTLPVEVEPRSLASYVSLLAEARCCPPPPCAIGSPPHSPPSRCPPPSQPATPSRPR